MRRISKQQEGNFRHAESILPALGVDLNAYLKDRLLYHPDGIELTNREAGVLLASLKQAMADRHLPRELRRPLVAGNLDGQAFRLVGDRMLSSDGLTIRQHPDIAETAFELGRLGDQRGRAKQ